MSDSELTLEQKVLRLKERYGSWNEVERRTGVKATTARRFAHNDYDMHPEHAELIEQAYERFDAEHVLGVEAVAQGLHNIQALRQTDTSDKQERILDRSESHLQSMMELLTTGDFEALKRRVCSVVLLFLLPVAAMAQAPGETITVTLPPDTVQCSDFETEQAARGFYEGVRLWTEADDAYGLDGDGDGQPCETIEVAKKEWFYPDAAAADTMRVTEGEKLWIEYELRPARVACGGLPDETFRVDGFLRRTRESVDGWNRDYLAYADQAECLHMLGVFKDAQ